MRAPSPRRIPSMSLGEPLLARLRAGELILLLGILIDLEHSTLSLDDAARMCGTAHDLGMTPFVRVPEREYGAIGRLLDGGAQAIVAPRIDTVAEAELVSRACRFAPRGQRSQLATVPQLGMRPTP